MTPRLSPLLGLTVLLVFLGALLLFLSCSAEPVPTARIPEGDYTLRGYVDRTVGDCEWVKRGLMTSVSVDARGQISSPLPGAQCKGFGARLTAHGVLEPSGADGTGEISGDVSGCTFVAFTFQLVRR